MLSPILHSDWTFLLNVFSIGFSLLLISTAVLGGRWVVRRGLEAMSRLVEALVGGAPGARAYAEAPRPARVPRATHAPAPSAAE